MIVVRLFKLVLVHLTLELLVVVGAQTVPLQQQNVNVDLSTYNKTNKASHVFTHYVNLKQGRANINIINPPNNLGIFVIQAHSFQANISLANANSIDALTGTNVGFVEENLQANNVYRYQLNYVETPNFRVLLTVVVYEKEAPVPGGCNLTFKSKIAPYQLVTYNDNVIKVSAQPASVYNRICESNPSHLDMYQLHLYERNLNEDNYFEGINKMLTVDSIKTYGKLVPPPIGHTMLTRYYSSYPGTGSVYAIIALYANYSSAYVPAVTYACDINNWDESCLGPVTVAWKILCAIILFLGLFTCYFGHRFFKTQMFIFGFVFGGFISYVSASINDTLSVGQSLAISILFGSIYGAMWIVFWWRFGSPVLSVFLPVAFIGYITSCIVFYTNVGDMIIFQSDLNYWGIFFSIVIPMTVFLLIATMYANILACSVLGGTAVIIAMDHYVGGSLHYAILNNIRRATVSNFNIAVIDPPFQYRDIILSVTWVLLIVTGFYAQLRQQQGKPPFPPPPVRARSSSARTSRVQTSTLPFNAATTRNNTERTPLLAGGYNIATYDD